MCKGMCQKMCGNKDLGLLILRIVPAITFLIAGITKFNDISMLAGGLTPVFGGFATFMAYLVATIEVVGGVSLLLGVFVRWTAPLLAMVMLTATYLAHWPMGKDILSSWMSSGHTLSLFAITLSLTFLGAGRYSLSKWCGCKCHKDGGDCKVCGAIGCEGKVGCAGGTCEVK